MVAKADPATEEKPLQDYRLLHLGRVNRRCCVGVFLHGMDRMTITEQIKCVEREIRMRERVYARWVGAGKMSAGKADYELRCMKAVLETLQAVNRKERLI